MDTCQSPERSAAHSEQNAPAGRAVTPSAAHRSPQRPLVVLIADDVSDTREMYAEYFEHRGYDVVTAPDGAVAVQAALDHAPDVIVMDLAMPQIDGITAIRRINATTKTPRSCVIMLTGYPKREIERRAYEAGVHLFLTKPCLPHELERHIVDQIGQRQGLAPGLSS
jgi:CheY-like chemotaxis protein